MIYNKFREESAKEVSERRARGSLPHKFPLYNFIKRCNKMIELQELKTLISLGFKKGDIENFYGEKIDFSGYLAANQNQHSTKQNQQVTRAVEQPEQYRETTQQQQPTHNENSRRDEQFEKLFARLDKLEQLFGMTQHPENENDLANIVYPGE